GLENPVQLFDELLPQLFLFMLRHIRFQTGAVRFGLQRLMLHFGLLGCKVSFGSGSGGIRLGLSTALGFQSLCLFRTSALCGFCCSLLLRLFSLGFHIGFTSGSSFTFLLGASFRLMLPKRSHAHLRQSERPHARLSRRRGCRVCASLPSLPAALTTL